ncbi:hypothetical protein, partial [Streptomyces edwardsiae]
PRIATPPIRRRGCDFILIPFRARMLFDISCTAVTLAHDDLITATETSQSAHYGKPVRELCLALEDIALQHI